MVPGGPRPHLLGGRPGKTTGVCASRMRRRPTLRLVFGRCGNISRTEGTSMEIRDPVAANTDTLEAPLMHDGTDAAQASPQFTPDTIVMHHNQGMGCNGKIGTESGR